MRRKELAVSPLVSVIMPAYNAAAFVEAAVRSVLAQTMEDWELIVVEDCSGDDTLSVLEELLSGLLDPRIRLLKNESNMGVAVTRNRGIDASRGQYIAFLDSDDIWYPAKLERQLAKMAASGAEIGYCSYAIIGPEGDKVRPDYLVPECVVFEDLLKENVMQCSAMLIRAEVVKEFRFNTEFYHEDYVLGLEMLRKGYTAVGCGDVLAAWRYMENSRSFNKWKSARNRWRIYRDFLKLPLGRSGYVFFCYMLAGMRKYFFKSR